MKNQITTDLPQIASLSTVSHTIDNNSQSPTSAQQQHHDHALLNGEHQDEYLSSAYFLHHHDSNNDNGSNYSLDFSLSPSSSLASRCPKRQQPVLFQNGIMNIGMNAEEVQEKQERQERQQSPVVLISPDFVYERCPAVDSVNMGEKRSEAFGTTLATAPHDEYSANDSANLCRGVGSSKRERSERNG